ncbi:pectate lyase [Sinomicrobium sp. M5D2P9]
MRLKYGLGLTLLFIALVYCSSSAEQDITDNPKGEPSGELEEQQTNPIEEEALAFPGAEGFGRDATGGRGGKVIKVTNLNDSGPGSFRSALETEGPRIVVFEISGNIALQNRLVIRNGDITIAGQTAPGGGICIKDYPVVVAADNVIIRFMRFRMGDEAQQEADALESRFQKNIIIDHCSMSWSTDECATFYSNENTTVQWCFITESLRNSVHGKGSHGYGGIWGGKNASFHHNLLAHHDSRNPRLGERVDESFALNGLTDLRNNVVYNWGNNSAYGAEAMNVNIVNCYYKPGPATPHSKRERIISIDKSLDDNSPVHNTWGKFYVSGNYVEGSDRATEDNWEYGVYNQFHNKYNITEGEKESLRLSSPLDVQDNIITHTAQEAYEKVIQFGGASINRDEVDKRIADEVIHGSYTFEGSNGSTNGIIDTQGDVGGWPELQIVEAPKDTDGDGIPDAWEEANGLDPLVADSDNRDLSTAYDNIEVYANSLVKVVTDGQK